jgi:hypothetical protein
VASFDKVIPPGQEGKITFEIDGKRVHGAFSKSAAVQTNDPKHSQLTITLAGKIVPYIEVQPSTTVYLTGIYGEQVSKELILTSNDRKKDFEILGVSSTMDDKITYSFRADPEPGRYRVTVWKNPKLPTLNSWGTLTIHTNSEKAPQKIIQISVATRGLIVCQPSQINFGPVKFTPTGALAKPAEKSLDIFKVEGEFQIRNVEFSSPDYEAEVEPLEDGKRYKIKVAFLPSSKKRNYYDEMTINTNDPQEPSVKIVLLAHGL